MMRLRMSRDRREGQHMVFVERRKGKIWMYGEIAVCAFLLFYLVSMLK